ncbi:3-dehydroquinate synthase [Flavobacterium cauense R2A-7]|uniref:3-dehydroquinate synthase n=1 Tax=Flavobacterium cauense R2A-7 TaxID=1341154 RepID=A0A562M1A1_9FLAO|nr:3-dehydroquinate synthase [Flavobacterium cauense]KGO81668.1 3-dehydroquinate synthase [Flavobacterium cauense R2A-7]TWI13696.1 3-dehydroquinate synthase [Flavobacterium cauense R2A-7]
MQIINANGYTVYFNDAIYTFLSETLRPEVYSKVFVLADSKTSVYCLPDFLANLATEVPLEIIEFEAGEHFKNIETCFEIWSALTELGGDRKSIIINLGGGVVTDLGGFVASTYKRGIEYINVPTTLLAMVDASIGGKNGVDLGSLKNQIGTITTPKAVLIDTNFLTTLPANEMRSGLAEMLKHGLIQNKEYWNKFKNLSGLNTDDLDVLIYESIQIKNNIVSQDPTENGIRKALNFGHTLGHAIESYFLDNNEKTPLLHGEAIAVGMVLESFLSLKKDLITAEEYFEIKTVILDMFGKVEFSQNDIEAIIVLLIHDKKNEFGKVQFALLDGIGNVKINQFTTNELISSAFEDYRN